MAQAAAKVESSDSDESSEEEDSSDDDAPPAKVCKPVGRRHAVFLHQPCTTLTGCAACHPTRDDMLPVICLHVS